MTFEVLTRRLFVAIALLCAFAVALGQELTVAQGVDVRTWDPHNEHTSAIDVLLNNVFDPLVKQDVDGSVIPALATSWSQETDTAWRFELRDDVVFHNGAGFTAADVKYSLERVSRDNTLIEWENLRQIESVEIVDDYTVIVHTHEQEPLLLQRLVRTGGYILPLDYIAEVGWDGFEAAPVGTGPYKLLEHRHSEQIVLQRFEDHFREQGHWETAVFRTIAEDSTRVNELIAGGVDIISNVPLQDVDRINNTDGIGTVRQPTQRIMLFMINTDEAAVTSDLRVRTAIDYAINNQQLLDVLFDGAGTPVRGRIHPGIFGMPDEYYDSFVYDPEYAQELLQEAGYGFGDLTISLAAPAGRYVQDAEIAQLVAVQLEAVGINVRLEILEWSAYFSRVWDGSVENLALIGLANNMGDGWYALRGLMCNGVDNARTNWCEPAFDELVNMVQTEADPTRRAELISEGAAMLTDNRIQIFLFHVDSVLGVRDGIEFEPRADELLFLPEIHPAAN